MDMDVEVLKDPDPFCLFCFVFWSAHGSGLCLFSQALSLSRVSLVAKKVCMAGSTAESYSLASRFRQICVEFRSLLAA